MNDSAGFGVVLAFGLLVLNWLAIRYIDVVAWLASFRCARRSTPVRGTGEHQGRRRNSRAVQPAPTEAAFSTTWLL
ncbi:hypothetical protein [Mesorhizobium sp. M0199]|uniref:hypothetical protein n=1 Tax=Mesorhizobium sp. M0199 TaxID=2956911 RepID=UPI0033372235